MADGFAALDGAAPVQLTLDDAHEASFGIGGHLPLVVACDRPVPSEQAYYLVHPEGKGDLYKVCVFRDWLVEQCR